MTNTHTQTPLAQQKATDCAPPPPPCLLTHKAVFYNTQTPTTPPCPPKIPPPPPPPPPPPLMRGPVVNLSPCLAHSGLKNTPCRSYNSREPVHICLWKCYNPYPSNNTSQSTSALPTLSDARSLFLFHFLCLAPMIFPLCIHSPILHF